MVCSSCGFENQASMRFCGMCGTPLPHRPLTAEGAQSTLNMTRVPLEGGSTVPESDSTSRSISATGVIEASPRETATISHVTTPPVSSTISAPVAPDVPPKELVPDISLEDYLKKFHYEPPSDTLETTMRGDAAPPIETDVQATPPPAPTSDADPPIIHSGIAPDVPDQIETPAKPVAPPRPPTLPAKPRVPEVAVPPGDSVVSRLGLEPESPAEEKVQRPRFLDVNEAPAKDSPPASTSGTSTIVGPSFLGLSDAPYIAADADALEDEAPRTSHWRGWVAVFILILFAALGFAEWRAQTHQTNEGPVEIIRTKLHKWRNGGTTPPDESASATLPAASNTSQPEMQVQEQPKPQTPQQSQSTTTPPFAAAAPSTSPSSTSTAPPAATQPSANNTAASKANPEATTSSADNQPPTKTPAPAKATSNNPPPETTKSVRRDNPDTKAAASAKQTLPGADEMTKAQNASDSAAAAAWLWKATAKGNPDAPVQLADMYIKGNGVPKSCEQALVLLKTAAEKENALARNRLASMYATGNCVQRNRVEAYRWLSSALAANPESQWAQQNRDLIWGQMTPEEQAAAQKYR